MLIQALQNVEFEKEIVTLLKLNVSTPKFVSRIEVKEIEIDFIIAFP